MKIGILGGTFDPPHVGHLIIAEEVRLELGLGEVWFIPTATPPHKSEAKSSAHHRLNMLRLAIDDNPYFSLNTIELDRKGASYTYDTIHFLREMHPEHQFYFIIGADMVAYLPHWYQIEELVKLVQFVGVKRKGYDFDTKYPVISADVPTIEVSSSMLRERLLQHKTIRYFVPKSVNRYIKENKLYGYQ
jgi:nicotinate-nucleotide adenylyltransferase